MNPAGILITLAFFLACGGVNAYRSAYMQRRTAAAAKIRTLQIEKQKLATRRLSRRSSSFQSDPEQWRRRQLSDTSLLVTPSVSLGDVD